MSQRDVHFWMLLLLTEGNSGSCPWHSLKSDVTKAFMSRRLISSVVKSYSKPSSESYWWCEFDAFKSCLRAGVLRTSEIQQD